MQSQSQWLDMYKRMMYIRSDYKLAKKWQTSASRISQIRRNRLRLTMAECLKIANALEIDPLEILAGLEYHRCKEQEKDLIKETYYDALVKTIGARMAAQSKGKGYFKKR